MLGTLWVVKLIQTARGEVLTPPHEPHAHVTPTNKDMKIHLTQSGLYWSGLLSV